MFRLLIGLTLALLAGCGPDYSPNTYASTAVQQANKVEQGVVVGVRRVDVSASGTTGALAGGAAGGIAGAQLPVGGSVGQAFGALGGTVVGGLVGATVERTTADTSAYEYIVRKPNDELVSVTQRDATPMALGQKVLVIAGTQARIVPDYTVPLAADARAPALPKDTAATAPIAPVFGQPLGPASLSMSVAPGSAVPGLPTLLAPITPSVPGPGVPGSGVPAAEVGGSQGAKPTPMTP